MVSREDQNNLDRELKAKRHRRQFIQLTVALGFVVIIILLLIGVLTVLNREDYSSIYQKRNSSILFYMLCILALVEIFLIVIFVVFAKNLTESNKGQLGKITSDLHGELNEFKSSVESYVSLRIIQLASLNEVCSALSELFNSSTESVTDGDGSRIAKVVYFGATSIKEDPNETSWDESEISPFRQYETSKSEATNARVKIVRYIRFFDKISFPHRTPEIRQSYLDFLDQELKNIRHETGQYILINARRAPRWKAIRSCVCSSDIYIDILGDGKSGFVVKSQEFSRGQLTKIHNFIAESQRKEYTIDNDLELEIHIQEMQKIHEELEKSKAGKNRSNKKNTTSSKAKKGKK